MFTYQDDFQSSITFAKKLDFEIDSEAIESEGSHVSDLINELTNLIPAVLSQLGFSGLDPIQEFGAQCANTHLAVLKFIKQYYPQLYPNLTIGGLGYKDKVHYSFSRSSFMKWQKIPPKIVDCHTWITLGSKTIIDCTGLTYIQTRANSNKKLGGIAYGEPGNLRVAEISSAHPQCETDTKGLHYFPTIVGLAAFRSVAPLAGQGQPNNSCHGTAAAPEFKR